MGRGPKLLLAMSSRPNSERFGSKKQQLEKNEASQGRSCARPTSCRPSILSVDSTLFFVPSVKFWFTPLLASISLGAERVFVTISWSHNCAWPQFLGPRTTESPTRIANHQPPYWPQNEAPASLLGKKSLPFCPALDPGCSAVTMSAATIFS